MSQYLTPNIGSPKVEGSNIVVTETGQSIAKPLTDALRDKVPTSSLLDLGTIAQATPYHASKAQYIGRALWQRGLTSEDIGLVADTVSGEANTAKINQALLDLAYMGAPLTILKDPSGLPFQVRCIAMASGAHLRIMGGIQTRAQQSTEMTNLAFDAISLNNVSDWIIDGEGYIDGNRSQMLSGTQSHAGIGGVGGRHGRVRVREIRNCYHWPINITTDVSDVIVEGVTCHDNTNSCQFAVRANDCHFRNCTIYNVGDEAISFYRGCFNCSAEFNTVYNGQFALISCLNDGGAALEANDGPAHDIMIRSNRMFGTYLHGGAVNASYVAPFNIRFHNNYIEGWGRGIGTDGNPVTSASGIALIAGYGHEIIGNTFKSGGHQSIQNNPIGILALSPCTGDLTITGNKFYDCGDMGGFSPFIFQGQRGVISHSNRVIESRAANSYSNDRRMGALYNGNVGFGSIIGPDSLFGSFSSSQISNGFTAASDLIRVAAGQRTAVPGMAMDSAGNPHFDGVVVTPGIQLTSPVVISGSKTSPVTRGDLASILTPGTFTDRTT